MSPKIKVIGEDVTKLLHQLVMENDIIRDELSRPQQKRDAIVRRKAIISSIKSLRREYYYLLMYNNL
jgi:hypothetical protein